MLWKTDSSIMKAKGAKRQGQEVDNNLELVEKEIVEIKGTSIIEIN